MKRLFILFITAALTLPPASATPLEYSPAPANNPLRGLVPYSGDWGDRTFPHSMEFSYFALKDLMLGWDQFDWTPLEKTLTEVSNRGHQLILRVYIEYPGKGNQVPDFLVKEGVLITTWFTEDGDQGAVATPDWEHPSMRRALREFITAFGKKYDNDPRIAFITAGLLGLWGEWHDFPRSDLWASKQTQSEVLSAFESAFPNTHILLRYPYGKNQTNSASNAHLPFGYHDDSFAWATLHTGKPDDFWFFLTTMKAADTLEKWKQHPIGGEIRPELWEQQFTDTPHPKAQNFLQCVRETHVSWLMDSGMFSEKSMSDPQRVQRALKETSHMGYELHISQFSLSKNQLSLKVENRGVAPFYYPWKVELEIDGKSIPNNWKPNNILPGSPATWSITLEEAPTSIRLRIPNPMPKGAPLTFANKEIKDSWLVLK